MNKLVLLALTDLLDGLGWPRYEVKGYYGFCSVAVKYDDGVNKYYWIRCDVHTMKVTVNQVDAL